MMYADAGVFVISLVSDEGARYVSDCTRFLAKVVRGERSVATSTLTWDEVVYAVRRLLGPEDSTGKADELLLLPNVRWIPTDVAVLRRAAGLYRSLPIRPRDAIHAACAIEAGEGEIVSEDRVFDRVPGLSRTWPPP